MVKLSAVIITFNEEEHIEKCLKSLAGVVEEIIVVDSFSTDNTVAICEKYKAKVITKKFAGYIEQKNYAISCAKYDYILSLDGDEALSPTLKSAIIGVKKDWKYQGYYCNRKNNYYGQWIKHSGRYPDKKMRLFKKGFGEWKGINPHDFYVLRNKSKSGKLKGDLLHWVYRDVEEHQQKIENFSTIAASSYYKLGIKSSIFKIYFRASWSFFKSYVLRVGFMNGYTGLIIGKLTYKYTYLKYRKLYELIHN